MQNQDWGRRAGRALLVVGVAMVGVLLLPALLAAAELELAGGSTVLFSDLDGSSIDGDAAANGTLMLDRLALAGSARVVIDIATARFEIAGDVDLRGRGAIAAAPGVAADLTIQAGGGIRLAGNSSIRSDGSAGGSVRLCAGGDLEIRGNAAVSASDLAGLADGGSVYLEAAGRLSIASSAAGVHANGASGGRVTLVSCGPGTVGPGSATRNAAVAIHGRVEAAGASGVGGSVAITARRGDVAFGSGLAGVNASGAGGAGTVQVTAAGVVSPPVPPSSPAATVTVDSPSELPCDCSTIPPLVVAAEVDPATGLSGTQFSFSGRVVATTSPVVDWQWTLSDGRAFSGQVISASFSEAGLYSARVVATDAAGVVVANETAVVVFDPNTQAPPIFGLPDVVGDVTGDGAVTLEDAHRAAKHAGGIELLPAEDAPAADVDLDGVVTPEDALLLGRAVAAGAPLPTVLLPDRGAPGARVNLISPALLDPTARIQIRFGESTWVQTPLRVARGYATFMVPLDATVAGSIRTEPGVVEVQVLSDGAVVETLSFEVEALAPLPADPKAELTAFLGDFVQLFALKRQALEGLLDYAGVDGDERELLLASFTAAEQDAEAKIEELLALLSAPGGDELARLFFLYANANGFAEFRQQLDEFLATSGPLVESFAANATAADVDEILAIICAVRDASDLLSTGGDLLSYGCDALLIAAVIAAAVPADGPVVDAALLFTWASACGAVEATVELALLINELVGSIEPDLRFEASPTSPGPGESAELKAEIEVTGLDDICAFGVGQGRNELIEELAETAIERLLRKKLALRAISKAVELLSEELLDELEDRLEELVVRAVDDTAIGEMLEELTNKVCDIFELGAPLLDDLSQIMEGPDPNVGTLSFNGDGTASYTCPEPDEPTADSVSFTASRDICGETVEKSVTVQCETRPVTITIGDNGFLNDDIFEVRIAGQTVLTSSVPVRAISTTVELAVGDHEVQMIGRAAPDGIGTYYISFSGATVIGGDPTSGRDLTPGVVKTFIIRVQ